MDIIIKLHHGYETSDPLWDYSVKSIGKFYLAWRKSIRRIFNIPYTTHCALLNDICGDMPVQDQLYIQYRSLLNRNNMLTRACANMVLQGSNLTVSNNITIISRHISKSRCEIVNVHKSQFDDVTISDDAFVIRDILHTKHGNLFTPTYSSFFTNEQLIFMLNTLCTIYIAPFVTLTIIHVEVNMYLKSTK